MAQYLASTYFITVDGLPLGEISYPFPVCLKPNTLIKLREDIGRRAGIRIDGIKIRHVSKAKVLDFASKKKPKRIEHKGKIS